MKVRCNNVAAHQVDERGARPPARVNVATPQIEVPDRTTLRSDRTVQSFTVQALTQPELRLAALDALKQSVETGAYQTEATRTAAAIVAHDGQ